MSALDPVPINAAALAVAVILAMAASHKLRLPARFAGQLADYALLPAALVGPAARLLPLVEALLALGLLLPAVRAPAALAAAALFALYALAMALNLVRGRRDIDCGCSGPGLERPLGAGLLARNAVLVLLALGAAAEPAARALGAFDVFVTVAAAAVALFLYAAADGLLAQAPRLARLTGR